MEQGTDHEWSLETYVEIKVHHHYSLLVFYQVYMWVGTQTSQVEIKLSLKACQVSDKLKFV